MLIPILLVIAAPMLPAAVPVAVRDDCTAAESGIRITVSGLRDRRGRLTLELYPANAEDFLADDTSLLRAGKTFRRVVTAVPSQAGAVSLCVGVPRPGRYAVLVIHKRAGGRKFSISDDGVALPGTERIGRHRPPVEQAIVTVPGGITTVATRMQYLRGLGGFKPIAQ